MCSPPLPTATGTEALPSPSGRAARLGKVVVIGGGPAGLAAALQFRQLGLTRQIRVIEQRPADVPGGGWGISLDSTAVATLAEMDPVAARRVQTALYPWDTVVLRRDREEVAAAGTPLGAITRDEFLGILRDRCRERDIQLSYGDAADAQAIRAYAAEADLLVGADGRHSGVRAASEDAFGSSVSLGANHFIWLAAESGQRYSSMVFRSTPHGVVFAYVYPFAPGTCTFIAECSERVWRGSKLAKMSPADSVEFVRQVFGEDLGSGSLLATDARWSRFGTVRNEHWFHGNVVLIGDAAHTAHFSVGLGTRLALEDVAELARCLSSKAELSAALAEYQRARQPLVAEGQRRAAESQSWFERFERYYQFPVDQLAFSWRARQHTTTFDRLRRMDPGFTARVCRILGDGGAGEPLTTPCAIATDVYPGRVAAVHDDHLMRNAALIPPGTDPGEPIPAALTFTRVPARPETGGRPAQEAGKADGFRTVTVGLRDVRLRSTLHALTVSGIRRVELDLAWRMPAGPDAMSWAQREARRIKATLSSAAAALGGAVIMRVRARFGDADRELLRAAALAVTTAECAAIHLVPVGRDDDVAGAFGRALDISDVLRNELGWLTIVSGPWRRDAANTAIAAGRLDMVGLVCDPRAGGPLFGSESTGSLVRPAPAGTGPP